MLWADHALLGGRRRSLIRKVDATELVSVDGVMQAPEEWALSSFNEESEAANASDMATSDHGHVGRVAAGARWLIGKDRQPCTAKTQTKTPRRSTSS